MDTTLKLYKETASGVGVKPMPFPDSGDKQACLSDYKYSATRMSSAPNITATLKWPRCLDDEWSTSVFVSYNGERFFVKNTPSSSYDNTSCLYSHSLELVSERAILDSVYFLNVPTITSDEGENPQGDSLSDSTEFTFPGDIHEFVDRLNKSLNKSGVGGRGGYSAVVDNGATSDTKLFSISNQYVTDVLKSAYELYNIPYYFVGRVIHFGNQQNIINTPPLEYGADNSLLSISKSNSNKQVVTRITGSGSDRNIPYYYPNPTPKGKIYLESTSTTATFVVKDDMLFCSNMDLDKWIEYTGVDYVVNIDDFSASSDGNNYKSFSSSDLFNAEFQKDVWIRFTFSVKNDFVDTYIDCRFDTIDRGERPLSELYVDSVLMGKDGVIATSFIDGMVNCGKLTKASYTITLHLRYGYAGSSNYDGYFKIKNLNKAYWRVMDSGKRFDINKASIYISSGAPKHGDRIKQTLDYRIDVKNKLMPSVYRRTHGDNMWYNATNSANRDEWYGDVQFDNEYDSRHPVEYIHTDEEIYPTITGMKNYEGENIDTFLDIAFDRDDNNEIYPEDYEDEKLAGKYKHPYFFVKLKKTDGPNGFNLFDHAIEGETMKISFTTGHVAGCEFEIGVDEETQKNPVQVDENGDLVIDNSTGNVIISGDYIPEQQDTQNNEVWIALKKEDSTMGVMMPDTASQLVPLDDKREGGGDKFVILGINLPEAYITAAEDRLEQELIKYLKENNRERFSFSLKLSSIYLAENEAFAKTLNENSRVTLLYNDTSYTMYVTSYSLTVKESSALPEVTISINDELKVVRPKVKDVSLFIDSTDTKIKNVRKTIQNTNESIKTLSEGSNNISNQLSTLIGDDVWMSAREIAERVSNPIDERVNTLIGTDINKSARTIATEVLAGASTGGDIDLSLYLSKSEAESTYATKESLKTTNDNIDSIDTRLGTAETNISNNSNLLSAHSQKITTLQTEQKSQNDTIKQQGATILALDVEVDGVKGDVSKANKAIESIETELENKADNSTVDSLSKDLVSTKAVVEIISPQVNANADAIKSKASQEEVNALSESVTTLEGSVEEISNRVDNKADKEDVQTLVSQINNVDTKANNALDKADKALTQIGQVAGEAQTAKEIADLAVVTANDVKKKADNNESNIERLGQDVVGIEDTLGTLNGYINTVAKKANDAYSRAETALEEADGAKELAETANETATKANTTADSVRAQMSGVLTQVQNNTTQIGIIGKDYLRKDQAADFATDLTGVVEATAEEFVYRPSAGDKSIRDKSAVIRRIKGNSVVWEQKLKPLTSDSWNQYSATYANIEFINNSATISLTSSYTGQNVYNIGLRYKASAQEYLSGHVYLIVGLCKLQSGGQLMIEMTGQSFYTNNISASPNKWVSFDMIFSPTKDASTFYIKPPSSYTNLREGSSYSVRNVMLFDLTAMFGAGNEPAAVEEFRKVYNEAYYPYCQPELRGVKTGAIKTVGFNLFDGECARVIGGMSYIVSNYTSAYYSETKNGAQTPIFIKDGIYTPECSGYLYLTGTADATPCVHFQHSGVMDGECAPYVEHTLNLPEILKLFPINGMHGLRNTYHDVYDEINIDNYIKRLEIVDLGSLWWNSDSSRQCFHAPLNTHKVRGIALCTRYTCSTLGGISDKQLSTHNYYGSDRIFIKDVDFDNPTDFMASLQGVYLVYELNEPIITPLSEPITLDYYCEDWGSEEAIPASSASAPFRADIVYQFNAEGRIRDNSRNIDKLEKIVAPLKVIPSNTPLATQGFVLSHIPTRVATATERVKMYEGQTQLLELLPNVMYDWTGGGSLLGSITIPPLYINTETIGTYDHQWMVRVGSDTSDKVTIPFDVLWKDGIAPNWTSWGICEITFKCDAQQDEAMRKIIGEWKIYK